MEKLGRNWEKYIKIKKIMRFHPTSAPNSCAITIKSTFSFPRTHKLYKIPKIFDKKWQKYPFFSRAPRAGGGCRQSPRQNFHAPIFGIPLFKTLALNPFLEFHFPYSTLHFGNSNSHRLPSTFGIPIPIIYPPLLEFHYLQITSNYGIPAILLTTSFLTSYLCLKLSKIPHIFNFN